MARCRPRHAAAPLVAVAAGLALLLAGGGLVPAGASVPAAAKIKVVTRWGAAQSVPGLAALNKGYDASVSSSGFAYANPAYPSESASTISCWVPGDCAAGGFYTDALHHKQAWVALERDGRWGNAIEVPGTAALNQGGIAGIYSMSCARTSACAAVGVYTDQTGGVDWFTATEREGRWGTAVEVPYPALNQAMIGTVWCEPGLCAAGGSFTDPSTGTAEAWVSTEVSGHWQPGIEVPGIAAVNVPSSQGDPVGIYAMSCTSAGNCTAGGLYTVGPNTTTYGPPTEAFVVNETNGTWGSLQETATDLNIQYGQAATTLMTCPSAGNCTATGYYSYTGDTGCDDNGSSCQSLFVVNEHHGTWDQASHARVPIILALTCPSAGDCVTAGGVQIDDYGDTNAALASDTNGRWNGTIVLANMSQADTVSCASPGYCAAGGTNLGNSAFVISEWAGKWGRPLVPAGIPSAEPSQYDTGAGVTALSCSPGKTVLCVAGGDVTGPRGGVQAFVVGQVRIRVR